MRVLIELLVPSMQHAEEADIGSQEFRVARDLEQCLGTGVEQQVVNHSLVLEGQWGQFVGQSEDDMNVRCRQEFARARLNPAVTRVGLTAGAMPVAARVERDGTISAARTPIEVTAQRRRATALDGGQYFQVQQVEPGLVPVEETPPGRADDISHLQR